MLKIQDLKNKSESELLALISELKGKLLALRFENATGQLTEIHLIKDTKRDIARVFTVLKQLQDKEEEKETTKEIKKVKKQNVVHREPTIEIVRSNLTTEIKKIDKTVEVSSKTTSPKKENDSIKNIKNGEIDLSKLKIVELKEIAKEMDLHNYSTMKKDELIKFITTEAKK